MERQKKKPPTLLDSDWNLLNQLEWRDQNHITYILEKERERPQGRRNKIFVAKPKAYFHPLQQLKGQNVVNKPNWLSSYGKPGGRAWQASLYFQRP